MYYKLQNNSYIITISTLSNKITKYPWVQEPQYSVYYMYCIDKECKLKILSTGTVI